MIVMKGCSTKNPAHNSVKLNILVTPCQKRIDSTCHQTPILNKNEKTHNSTRYQILKILQQSVVTIRSR